MSDRFFIKESYKANNEAITFEGDRTDVYWTSSRFSAACTNFYQYYVYRKCTVIAKKHSPVRFLDVGCGPPIKVRDMLAPYCSRIVLIDQPSLSPFITEIFPMAEFIPANLEKIDISLTEKFDFVVCADVLEHLLNPNPCVDFIREHLADEGQAFFSTPERDYRRGKNCDHSPKPEHVREWNSTEFAKFIASRGFIVLRHFLLPQLKINHFEYLLSRFLSPVVHNQRWSACQMLVCGRQR